MKIGRRLAWQGSLIVLPVAMLAGFALNFLREDKASIEQEARARAQALAPELAQRFAERAAASLRGLAGALEGIIENGRALIPPAYPRVPDSPEWPNRLTPEQAQSWEAAQNAMYRAPDAAAARRILGALTNRGLQPALRANAELALLRIDSAGGLNESLARRLVELARRSRDILTGSGAPLPDVALLIALGVPRRVRLDGASLAEVGKSAREYPSFLTPDVLDAARTAAPLELASKVQAIRAAWEADERTRRLLAALPAAAQTQLAEAWVEDGPERFLALSTPEGPRRRVRFYPAGAVERTIADALESDRDRLPAYAAISVRLGGRSIPALAGAPLVLTSTTGQLQGHPFAFSVVAASPESLYAGYRNRLWFTAALIVCAAGTALFGLGSLWRGFRKEVRLSELKSNFVSSVSHELRAPIAAVRLMAESLESGRVEDEQKRKEYFRMIGHECRRLAALVENVLDFSRIDQGRKQYTFEPVDISALARHTVALMAPCAAERQVRLTLAGPAPAGPELEPCWDGQAIEQSLVNLLDNAIKHSPAGAEVEIRIECATGGPVRLWVEDHGPGIPKEEQARIFDLFYRRGSELRRETQGAGIGLSIVKHVAEAHGGRVLVESAPGAGSRFALELPLKRP